VLTFLSCKFEWIFFGEINHKEKVVPDVVVKRDVFFETISFPFELRANQVWNNELKLIGREVGVVGREPRDAANETIVLHVVFDELFFITKFWEGINNDTKNDI